MLPTMTRAETGNAAYDIVAHWPAHDLQRLALILITGLWQVLPSSHDVAWLDWLSNTRVTVPKETDHV